MARALLAVAALHLYLVMMNLERGQGELWVPGRKDLETIPGVLHVDETSDEWEWAEINGPEPEPLNSAGLLATAFRAALPYTGTQQPKAALQTGTEQTLTKVAPKVKTIFCPR